MVTVTYFLILQSKRMQPVQAEALPVCKPLKVCIRLAEELKLHLLELTGTECEVTRCDLVTEGFTDLTDTKWNLLTDVLCTFLKFTKIPCAVSGLKYTVFLASSVTPWKVLNIMVELTDVCEICVLPQEGHGTLCSSMKFFISS